MKGRPRSTGSFGMFLRREDVRTALLNGMIMIAAVVVGLLAYSLLNRTLLRPPLQTQRAGVSPLPTGTTIQLDVLNGCGAAGVANECTSYLRARGYDVVELRNYKTFDVQESMVVDRTGNRENAERVAAALGIARHHILQQINPDYYVDVSVVIGRDFRSLKPSP